MNYVLDTNFFVRSRFYYPDRFPSFWEKMDEGISDGIISSVKEVMKELERYEGRQEHLLKWIKSHGHIFTEPSADEQDKIRQILGVPDFQQLVNSKNLLRGRPAADPFVIAKAWDTGAVVVTTETPASENQPPKIPNVCAHFEVDCITPEAFMEREGWQF